MLLILCLSFSPISIGAEPASNEPVLVEVACIILGSVIVAGGTWMGYKIYKTAKNKLYPPPPVPQVTNVVSHAASFAGPCMGRHESEGIIYRLDVSRMTDDDKAANVLPDGSQATSYATATLKGSEDLQNWVSSPPIEIWFSGTCYLVRCGDFVDSGANSITNMATGEMSMRPVVIDNAQPASTSRFFKTTASP